MRHKQVFPIQSETGDFLLNPNPAGGGHISPPVFQKIIALEPNVGLTSDQAVNSSLSNVLRSKKN